jgi:hypothetical protein
LRDGGKYGWIVDADAAMTASDNDDYDSDDEVDVHTCTTFIREMALLTLDAAFGRETEGCCG